MRGRDERRRRCGSDTDELVGPFYDADGVTGYLGLDGDDLARMVAAEQVIWVPLAGGTPVFLRGSSPTVAGWMSGC